MLSALRAANMASDRDGTVSSGVAVPCKGRSAERRAEESVSVLAAKERVGAQHGEHHSCRGKDQTDCSATGWSARGVSGIHARRGWTNRSLLEMLKALKNCLHFIQPPIYCRVTHIGARAQARPANCHFWRLPSFFVVTSPGLGPDNANSRSKPLDNS